MSLFKSGFQEQSISLSQDYSIGRSFTHRTALPDLLNECSGNVVPLATAPPHLLPLAEVRGVRAVPDDEHGLGALLVLGAVPRAEAQLGEVARPARQVDGQRRGRRRPKQQQRGQEGLLHRGHRHGCERRGLIDRLTA